MTRGPALLTAPRGAATPPARRRGRLRGAFSGFRDSCALCAVALLGCVALVALGAVVSVFWALLGEL